MIRALLYLTTEALWTLIDRLLPEDKPRPEWHTEQTRQSEQVRTEWLKKQQGRRSNP